MVLVRLYSGISMVMIISLIIEVSIRVIIGISVDSRWLIVCVFFCLNVLVVLSSMVFSVLDFLLIWIICRVRCGKCLLCVSEVDRLLLFLIFLLVVFMLVVSVWLFSMLWVMFRLDSSGILLCSSVLRVCVSCVVFSLVISVLMLWCCSSQLFSVRWNVGWCSLCLIISVISVGIMIIVIQFLCIIVLVVSIYWVNQGKVMFRFLYMVVNCGII